LRYCILVMSLVVLNAAFTLNGDDQEPNLAFVKTHFQVLKLKFHVCSFKQAFHPVQNIT